MPSWIASFTPRIESKSRPKTPCENRGPTCPMPDSLISNHSAYVASLRCLSAITGSAVRHDRNAQHFPCGLGREGFQASLPRVVVQMLYRVPRRGINYLRPMDRTRSASGGTDPGFGANYQQYGRSR
jgi:hypothetical protein